LGPVKRWHQYTTAHDQGQCINYRLPAISIEQNGALVQIFRDALQIFLCHVHRFLLRFHGFCDANIHLQFLLVVLNGFHLNIDLIFQDVGQFIVSGGGGSGAICGIRQRRSATTITCTATLVDSGLFRAKSLARSNNE
jgi:hypothetical protein